MITLKNITKNLSTVINATHFPDGTQQVWKVDEEVLDIGKKQIVWHFERDSEIVTLLQLQMLLDTREKYHTQLVIPFLPYGRQDKEVSNNTTFGLQTFMKMLNPFFMDIVTYDAHNYKALNMKITSLNVDSQLHQALELSKAHLVCFPDKGATTRGYDLNGVPSFHLSKTRDQQTGQITGMVCDLPLDLVSKNILIVDDICDGGKTFIEAAKVLYGMGADKVDLYVTHGIFSKGTTILRELGEINHIYTTDSYKSLACDMGVAAGNVTVLKLEI